MPGRSRSPHLQHSMTLNFQGQLAFENEEELPGMKVRVSNLICTGSHELFDDAEFWRFNKVPVIAVNSARAAPRVMFCRFGAYYLCKPED